MNCRQFESNLADYIAGRLPPADAAQMNAHSDACAVCAREEQQERALRVRFVASPVVPPVTDLWPRVVAQLPERRPRFAFPRLWLAAPALTAAAAVAVLFWSLPRPDVTGPVRVPSNPVSGSPVRLSTLVNEVREIGIPESEMLLDETDSSRQMGRLAVAEGGSR
jgi:anti-sigma factor RsiW